MSSSPSCLRIGCPVALAAILACTVGGCRVMSADAGSADASASGIEVDDAGADPPASSAFADEFTSLPGDFALDLVVQSGRRPGGLDDAARRSYVLFADGALHVGPSTPWTLPPEVRTLSRAQMAAVFEDVRRLGLIEDPQRAPSRSLVDLEPPPGATRLGLTVTGGDVRWSFVESPSSPRGAALIALEERLAALGWVAIPQRVETVIVPKRYDLGPDPYARYR